MIEIKLLLGSETYFAALDDTPTTQKILKVLPAESSANTWGDEIYFEVPVHAKLESNATDVVEPGTVCFWVEGDSVAIPFGPTPASRGKDCRLVTRVNILGKMKGNLSGLKKVRSGDLVKLSLAR